MFFEIRKELLSVLPFTLCTVGESPEQGLIERPEGLELHEFIWVLNGEGVFTAKDETVRLTKNHGIFIKKDVPHSYHAAGGTLHTQWLTFSGGDGALDYFNMPDFYVFKVPAYLSAATYDLMHLSVESTALSRSSSGYAWLTELLESLFSPAAPVTEAIRNFLEAHYAQPLSLDDIAASVDMDRFSICHYYKKEKGITVIDHLKKIRIAKAKQFLRYSSSSTAEIAGLCGFESPSYFGKRFREETGHSPGEYRKLHLGG